ncbi:MAG: DedA family protein [Actinomycetota bacterium]|nr:DedA family protein [Actinomycetota bacterium]
MSLLWVYVVLFALAVGESSAFLGLAVPGEAAVLGAGALAARGELDLAPVIVLVVVGAALGDTIGYGLGKRLGHGRDHGLLGKVWSCARMRRVRAYMDEHGRRTIFVARFVGFFRALVPFAAGAVRMPYRPFLVYNLAGAIVWGTGTVLVGYVAGETAIDAVESASVFTAALVATVGILVYLVHRQRTAPVAGEIVAAVDER